MHRSRALLTLFLGLPLAAPTANAENRNTPPPPTEARRTLSEKSELMPDLCQTDPAFKALPKRGGMFCGPTAVANVLAYLDRTRFPTLVPGDTREKPTQLALLQALGAKERVEAAILEGVLELRIRREVF
ncbi:MAG: hypothetical protein ACYS22_05770 [Planctomycetota bacterium]|jgi:hypothetical protein